MRRRDFISKIISFLLILLMLGFSFTSIAGGKKTVPDDPIEAASETVYPQSLNGIAEELIEEEEKTETEEETKPEEETEPEEEPETEEETEPEEESETKQEDDKDQEEENEDPIDVTEEKEPEENDDSDLIEEGKNGKKETEDGNGRKTEGGEEGDEAGEGESAPAESDKKKEDDKEGDERNSESEEKKDNVPFKEELIIYTDLVSGTVTQDSLPDGLLCFSAWGEGADDLTVKVKVRNISELSQETIRGTGDNFSYQLELGETYQFTFYLYREGKSTGLYTTRNITYQARKADAEHREIGDYPPYISTNIDYLEDYSEIQGEELPLVVTVHSNPDGKVITADRIAVTLNGRSVDKHTGDSSPEYDLYFEPPNVGDYKEYHIEIVAWSGNNSTYWDKTLTYHAAAEGDKTGEVYVVIDATTVGLGILDEGEVPIIKGVRDTAEDVLLEFLSEYGYEYTAKKGADFYLNGIIRGDTFDGDGIPEELLEVIKRDEITLNLEQHDRDSLSEFDYTMGSGWMYQVNETFPGRAMNAYKMKGGDTLYLRFTLAYGKDVGGYEASGGNLTRLSSYCGIWIDGDYQELEHHFRETDRREPTDSEDGYIEYTCSRCELVRHEVIERKPESEEPESVEPESKEPESEEPESEEPESEEPESKEPESEEPESEESESEEPESEEPESEEPESKEPESEEPESEEPGSEEHGSEESESGEPEL